MRIYDYLIIGGGMVADAAARGIRERDETATIGILSADVDEPYARPALSKKLWTDPDFSWNDAPLGTVHDTGAELHLGTRVTELDLVNRRVSLESGDTAGFGRLLIATGSTPHSVPGPFDERVIAFRSAQDYRTLRSISEARGHVIVAGGGYIGTELAAALVQNGVGVTLVIPDRTLGASTFPKDLAKAYEQLFLDRGVEIVKKRHVVETRTEARAVTAVLDDRSTCTADAIVLGLGAEPVTDFAAHAGLAVGDGIVVDEHLRTTDPSVWAAGDVASYPDAILGRIRIEHVDNAIEMGKVAGRVMAGSEESYVHTPYFYSQVFGVRWEAVGTLDPELDTLEVELDDDRRVVYYRTATGAAIGVLLWNVEGARDAARAAIADGVSDEDELRGLIS